MFKDRRAFSVASVTGQRCLQIINNKRQQDDVAHNDPILGQEKYNKYIFVNKYIFKNMS